MITAIRNYLIKDTQLIQLLNNKPSIYFINKPIKATETEYITYSYKLITGGYVKVYELTMNFEGKDLSKLLQIQDRVIELLDKYKSDDMNFITDENNKIRTIELLNGGGQIFDEESKQYILISYFKFQI